MRSESLSGKTLGKVMSARQVVLVVAAMVGVVTRSATGSEDIPSREAARAGQDEERRRGGMCMNSSVYAPAMKESCVPPDVGQMPVLDPRIRERHYKLLCYTVAGDTLWVADDQCLYRISGPARKVIAAYTAAEGLPDVVVQSIAVRGDEVWLATLGGLAKLDVRSGRITAVSEIVFTVGELAAGPSGVWLVSDTGVYWLGRESNQWRKLPEFPCVKSLAATVKKGFWWFMWANKEVVLIEQMLATQDSLCVLQDQQVWRYDSNAEKWLSITRDAWKILEHKGTLWVMCTSAVKRYDTASGSIRSYEYGKGPALGRATAMAATDDAFYLASYGDYDEKTTQVESFVGGGISRLDLATDRWTVVDEIDGVKLNFVDSLLAVGDEVWAAALLYDKIVQEGAHPGMAHVKRWVPHPDGIGIAHFSAGRWSLLSKRGLKTQKRWMGPHGTRVELDNIGPQNAHMQCATRDRLWGAYKIVPEHWYGGYGESAGCLAARMDGRWEGRFDVQTEELNLTGEHPALFGMSRSHGEVYLAEGHFIILGLENISGHCWVVTQGGVYVNDERTDRFVTVLEGRDRLYFRATAAAPTVDAVWIGGDGGTVSRLDRRTGRLELVGVVPGRTITAIGVDGKRVVVNTAPPEGKYPIALPYSMRSANRLPVADSLAFDGEKWTVSDEKISPSDTAYRCNYTGPYRDVAARQENFLYRGEQKVAFLRGVFRPQVLCADPVGGKIWLGIYSGLASVPPPPERVTEQKSAQ